MPACCLDTVSTREQDGQLNRSLSLAAAGAAFAGAASCGAAGAETGTRSPQSAHRSVPEKPAETRSWLPHDGQGIVPPCGRAAAGRSGGAGAGAGGAGGGGALFLRPLRMSSMVRVRSRSTRMLEPRSRCTSSTIHWVLPCSVILA